MAQIFVSGVAHFFVVVGGSKIHERMAHFFIDIYSEKLILFKNMNKTGAGMVSDTVAAPVFCHFRAQNPHYFWYFFAEQRARKFCE